MAERDLAHGELTRRIIECFFKTFRELGSGFSERVYQRAFRIVMTEHGLTVGYNVKFEVHFHGKKIGVFYADLVVNETVLIEVKARRQLKPADTGQAINYLKAAGGGVALLVNFGPGAADYKRIVQGDPINSLPALKQTT